MPGLDTAIASLTRRVLALVVVMTASATLAACNGDDDSPSTNLNPGPDPDEVATSEVEIEDLAFDPPGIAVAAGNLVQWTNRDYTGDAAPATAPPGETTPLTGPMPATEHTVTADDGSFDSGPLTGDATFTYTFQAPGAYAYHCSIHSSMTGTVTVT